MLTNNDVFALYEGLSKVGNLSGAKFAYAVAKNQDILKSEIQSLQKTVAPSKEFIAYDKERIELAKKHAKKDEKGNPQIVDGKAYDIEDVDAFNQELEVLKKKYEEAIASRETQLKEAEEFLKQESKVELHKIVSTDLPKDITPDQLKGIISIVE